MENASKALLIAGAILIVILLIALGMMVYRGAQGSINKAIGAMSSTEKDIHNAQFEPYIGKNISGSNVRTLLSKVTTNNSNDSNVKVTVKSSKTEFGASLNTTEPSGMMGNVNTSASTTYTVKATYTDGVITELNIS